MHIFVGTSPLFRIMSCHGNEYALCWPLSLHTYNQKTIYTRFIQHLLKTNVFKSISCQKSLFPFSGTPPTNDKILSLNFLEFGTDICWGLFYGYLHCTTLCFGAKIISQGIILTLKVKVPCLDPLCTSVVWFHGISLNWQRQFRLECWRELKCHALRL